ncbi:DUF6175 family protein [Spongiimicrobium salis]|uniref:DUF6175 family protein n=1 Tax=Spongiimicrobium salis TaxID=1667022 RepID=UPI00374D63FF
MRTIKTLLKSTVFILGICCCIPNISFGQSEEVERVQPSIIVLPRTKQGEDLRTIMDTKPEIRIGISRVKQGFDDRGYTTLDFETLLKSMIVDKAATSDSQSEFKNRLFRNIAADIIVEIDLTPYFTKGGNSVDIVLEANLTDNGQSMGSYICKSNQFYTPKISDLTDRALKKEVRDLKLPCFEVFLERMRPKWQAIRDNGKQVKIDFSFHEDSSWTMNKDVPVKNDKLKYVIEDWLEDTAYKNQVVVPIVTDTKLFVERYHYPIQDEKTNRNITPRHIERKLDRFFDRIKIPIKIDNSRGTLFVTIL